MSLVQIIRRATLLAVALVCVGASPSVASDRFCDPSVEDCRAPLLTLIANERVGIDIGF